MDNFPSKLELAQNQEQSAAQRSVARFGNPPRHPIVQKWLDGADDAGGCIASLERKLARMEHAFTNILTLIDGKVDVEDGDEGPDPNVFMQIQMEIDEARK